MKQKVPKNGTKSISRPSHGGSDPVPGYISSWLKAQPNPTITPAPQINEQSLLYVVFLPTESTVPPNVGGWHCSTMYNNTSSADDLFYAVIETNGRTTPLASNVAISQIVGHELAEAFTDRDGEGFLKTLSCVFQGQNETDNCEIGDNCEQLPPFNYSVGTRGWQIQQYWSNWDNTCIHGDQAVSIKKFLQVIGVDGIQGLRQLNSSVININFVASKM